MTKPIRNRKSNWVTVYSDHHFVTDVSFKWTWQARLFHILLNASDSEHAGTRGY